MCAEPELQEVLQKFFKMHCMPAESAAFDLTRFLAAQAALSKVSGVTFSPMFATSVFCDLNERCKGKGAGGTQLFNAFSDWQLRQFQQMGYNQDKIAKTLHSAMPAVQVEVQSTVSAEKLRDARIRRATDRRQQDVAIKPFKVSSDLEFEKRKALLVAMKLERSEQVPSAGDLPKVKPSPSPAEPEKIEHVELEQSNQTPSAAELEKRVLESKTKSKWTGKAASQTHTASGSSQQSKSQKLTCSRSLGFQLESNKDLICKAMSMPYQDTGSIQGLAEYLGSKGSDTEKAWAIFVWICNHISYDVEGFRGQARRQSCDPRDVLRSRTCVCQGYANLFEAIAKAAGLEARVIGGLSRNEGGGGSHAWNAVRLEGEWKLLDCCWGAGSVDTKFERFFKPFYFGVPPVEFLLSHFPDNPEDQFMESPMSHEDFVSQPHLHPSFFSLGLALHPGTGGLLACHKRKLLLPILAPAGTHIRVSIASQDLQAGEGSSKGLTFSLPSAADAGNESMKVFAKTGSAFGSYECVASFKLRIS
mmetsp:Transcript_20143/g.35764  ORF Transcript_20143/g.35764 Transcript_20143/m.35764 type:complete len:531 (+) Transcript_20143:65-1657(+)